jgi:Protein of unknown function (DUF1344).
MKQIIVAAAASLLAVSAAFAGEVEGVVQAVDPAAGTVTLETGETFQATEGVILDGIQAGSTVQISFADGTTNATAIAVK